MIESFYIKHYRKLKDIELNFQPDINIISGTNGTCKSSLLHMISNSFQGVTKKCEWINDANCLNIINLINNDLNPKIESLTRGDKEYNDPAQNTDGSLFTVKYFDNKSTQFRRHNSRSANRFAIKPYYKRGSGEKLPFLPVLYLGLKRLYPFGELQNDELINTARKKLPDPYLEEISNLYYDFTGLKIQSSVPQSIGDIKTRSDFSSTIEGIDSNTISAGEDNLHIILTALVSLKYYYESISPAKQIESILLIDELDASLHPSFQIKLLYLFNEYSQKYKIQFFFTTHSFSLLEESLKIKKNVIYLCDNITSVFQMDDVDIYKIKMHLSQKTDHELLYDNKIPIFTEDNEARVFLSIIFDYYSEIFENSFNDVRHYFHLVDANLGSGNLTNIFNDDYLLRSTMRSICILDGDQLSKYNITNHIIVLPGKDSPENFIMNYAIERYEDDEDKFFSTDIIVNKGYSKPKFRDDILKDYNNIKIKIADLKSKGCSTKGVDREEKKSFFNKYTVFFKLVFKYWVRDKRNEPEIHKFYNDLKILFIKVSEFHNINPKSWK